ncbi:hypothetical protein HN358_00295 [Candidatus Uhrbacteria bacterium]|jgi:hypothetical protein|nr:hypothetical protein [Candidatus Uhrbacteria bacterium]MBT7717718.1 hypothetical protein [Candidatus Uhrbacteria bacterium]
MPVKVSDKVEVKPQEKPVEAFAPESLFGSKTRVRLLNLFLEHPDRPFYVREITRKVDAQLNSVRRELQNLIGLNVISEVAGKIISTESEVPKKKTKDKKKYYIANKECPFFEELRGMMKKMAILMNHSLVGELQDAGSLDLLLLTGRFIDNSDVASDILVVGDISDKRLVKAMESLESKLAREINYTYMPTDEYTYRFEVKDRFLMSLLESDKVILVNKVNLSL